MIPLESILKEYLSQVFTSSVKNKQIPQVIPEEKNHGIVNNHIVGLEDDESLESLESINTAASFPNEDFEVSNTKEDYGDNFSVGKNEFGEINKFAKDNNGSYDAVPTMFLPVSQTDTSKKEFPVHIRDDMVKQMIMFRSKFQNYKSYAFAPFDSIFTKEEMKNALILKANYFKNSYLLT